MASVPVAVIASENRPQYLFRSLRSLMAAKGSRLQNLRVYIDGTEKREALDLCDLLGVKGGACDVVQLERAKSRPFSEPFSLLSPFHYHFSSSVQVSRSSLMVSRMRVFPSITCLRFPRYLTNLWRRPTRL
jgi:hypothetical protein